MLIQDLLQHTDSNSLVEIVHYDSRIFYGQVRKLPIQVWNLLNNVEVIAQNCSIIQTGPSVQEALIQIIV